MIVELEKEKEIVIANDRADRRPLVAACALTLGFALIIAAATLWTLSLVGHDDGKDVPILLLAALACFGGAGHSMDSIERDRRHGRE